MTHRKRNYLYVLFGLLTLLSTGRVEAASLVENARAHYRLAHHLAKNGEHERAIEEYSTAYRLSPDSLVGRYSHQALTSYGVVADQSKIRKQVEEMRARQGNFAKKEILSRNRFTSNKLKNIENQKNQDIRDVFNNPSYKTAFNPYFPNNPYVRVGRLHNPFVKVPDPVATQARIDLVKADAESRKQQLIEVANQKSNQLLDTASRKAALIEESAENLSSQMTGKGTRLKARGTNLYVRSYR